MRIWWGIGIVGIMSGCGAALAQPDYPQRRFDITLAARTTYDSNALRRGAQAGADDGLRSEDVRFTPTATLDIVYPVSRQSLFFNGVIGYDFYAHNTRFNRERLNLAAGADLRFGVSCGARLTGEYARRQSDLADIIGLSRLTNTEELRAFEAQANCGDAYGLQPGFGYRHEVARNSRSLLERNDYDSDSFNAQIAYVRPTFGSLSLFSTYRTTTYPKRFVGPGLGDDKVEIYTAGARYERQIGSRLRGAVSVGVTRVDPKLPVVPAFKGASYSADLTYTPTDRFQLDLSFAREAQVSNLISSNYSIDDSYALDAQYALSERLRLLYGASYKKRDFRVSPDAPPALSIVGDKTYLGYVGARYELTRRMNVDVNFTQQRRDSENPLFNYKSTQVSAGVNLSF